MDLAEVRSESFLPTHFKPPSLLQGLYLDGQLQYPRPLPEGSLLLSTLLLSTFLLHQVPNLPPLILSLLSGGSDHGREDDSGATAVTMDLLIRTKCLILGRGRQGSSIVSGLFEKRLSEFEGMCQLFSGVREGMREAGEYCKHLEEMFFPSSSLNFCRHCEKRVLSLASRCSCVRLVHIHYEKKSILLDLTRL